jgi:uncharacterized SAM-binding protein YcdF (DUF218 family)
MSYTEPLLPIVVAILLIASIRMRNQPGRRLLAIGAAGLFAVSWPPLQCLFALPLEAPFWNQRVSEARPEAIVVLGSAISPPMSDQQFAIPDQDSVTHAAMAAWLYRATGVPVLACEGSHGSLVFPSVLEPLLRAFGVAEERIWIEARSRNTHENAIYAAKILAPYGIRRIALVTDAQSMARAAASFRKQGLTVIPAPCDFSELDFNLRELLPGWRAIHRNERGLHETVGLAWYTLRGWI